MRHLLAAFTVWCCYLATWGPTHYFGVDAVRRHAQEHPGSMRSLWLAPPEPTIPLVLRQDDLRAGRREYYLWLLGPVWRLPWRLGLPVEAASGAT